MHGGALVSSVSEEESKKMSGLKKRKRRKKKRERRKKEREKRKEEKERKKVRIAGA